jgi:hypothetical protein
MRRNSESHPKLDEDTEVVEMTREEARLLYDVIEESPGFQELLDALDEAQGAAIDKVSFLIIRITP